MWDSYKHDFQPMAESVQLAFLYSTGETYIIEKMSKGLKF